MGWVFVVVVVVVCLECGAGGGGGGSSLFCGCCNFVFVVSCFNLLQLTLNKFLFKPNT